MVYIQLVLYIQLVVVVEVVVVAMVFQLKSVKPVVLSFTCIGQAQQVHIAAGLVLML